VRIVDLPVANAAEVIELVLEHALRRLVAMRGEVHHETFVARCKPARRFLEHVLGMRTLAEQPELVDQHEAGLLAAHDLRRRPRRPSSSESVHEVTDQPLVIDRA
jgi:hypothetical protein